MEKQQRVIALGFFDGVHLGHGALLQAVKEKADRLGAVPTAFTFDKSPTAVITGQAVPLLSTVEDRILLMRQCYGMREVVVAPFDAMQRMDWEEFIVRYLVETLGVVHVVAGHDFHFGYMGKGSPERLKAKCTELGVGCDIIQKVERDSITVSSTYIRTLVAQGEMERARWATERGSAAPPWGSPPSICACPRGSSSPPLASTPQGYGLTARAVPLSQTWESAPRWRTTTDG